MGVFGVKATPEGKLNDSSIFVNQQLQRGGNEGEGCGGQGFNDLCRSSGICNVLNS